MSLTKSNKMRYWTYLRRAYGVYGGYVQVIINTFNTTVLMLTQIFGIAVNIAIALMVAGFAAAGVTLIIIGAWDYRKGAYQTDARADYFNHPFYQDLIRYLQTSDRDYLKEWMNPAFARSWEKPKGDKP